MYVCVGGCVCAICIMYCIDIVQSLPRFTKLNIYNKNIVSNLYIIKCQNIIKHS